MLRSPCYLTSRYRATLALFASLRLAIARRRSASLHQIEALVQAGVKDIVLAVNYRPEVMVAMLQQTEEKYGITINFSVETEPLGTAGPLALARDILGKDDSPFFVLNSDVTCSYPFEQFRDFHLKHGGEGSIMVTKVAEPSAYGVVVTKPGSTVIDRFVEKPQVFVGNRINAGIYMFNPSVLDRIELRPTSIEKEIFPAVAADQQLHAFDLQGFWMDVGQPKDYLSGTCLYLSHLTATHSPLLTDPTKNRWVYGGNVLVDPTAEIDPTALIGPNVVIGPGVKIGPGARLQRCVVLSNAVVRDHAWIMSSIIGWNSSVGRWARIENITVLGDDVSIKDELYVNGASVLPHKSVSATPVARRLERSEERINPLKAQLVVIPLLTLTPLRYPRASPNRVLSCSATDFLSPFLDIFSIHLFCQRCLLPSLDVFHLLCPRRLNPADFPRRTLGLKPLGHLRHPNANDDHDPRKRIPHRNA